jgi:hypothetical protein
MPQLSFVVSRIIKGGRSHMTQRIHLVAALLSTLIIATFFLSTMLVELFGSSEAVACVKSLIVIPGVLLLVPAIAVTGGSGFVLSKSRRGVLVDVKKKRMPFIAVNGLLILIPCAIFLDLRAAKGVFDTRFYLIQVLELLAGGTNLVLMGLNMRDGLRLTGRLRPN